MASASALAGAFTTLGVAANKTAKRTNVVAKKVRPRIIPPAMDASATSSEDCRGAKRGGRTRARSAAARRARRVDRRPDPLDRFPPGA
jgi:hypothetical protein